MSIEEFWREHYRALADASEGAASGRNTYGPDELEAVCEDARKALDIKPTDVLLDVGGAKGMMTRWLARSAKACICLDYVEAFRPDVVGDAISLPFKDGVFDSAVLSGVLLYIRPERHTWALGELRRVVKPKGRVFVGANPCVEVSPHACIFEIQSLRRLAMESGWDRADLVPTNPKAEQAHYYFDLVLS